MPGPSSAGAAGFFCSNVRFIFFGYNHLMRNLERISNYIILTVIFFFFSFSNAQLGDIQDHLHILVADHGFDFVTWTANAAWIKLSQSAIAAPRYFTTQEQHQIVIDSMQVTRDIENTSQQINLINSDPDIKDPAVASADLRQKLDTLNKRWDAIAPFAEATLEMQVTTVLDDLGLTSGGQPIPWVLYHVTPLPQNLVISKREKIGAETNYVLTPISVPEANTLENTVDQHLDVSSLVVNIGGLAAYPTMIMRTTALDWLSNTIAHEWTHIYLGQRPLGINYTTPELRTMNETTASIAGTEIGRIVMERYYPELLTQDTPPNQLVSHQTDTTKPPAFDFRAEMHTTRVNADALLAQGKISEAEAYMETQRKVFWDNGYPIRKINQAYFAFYGSYADTPGGAAGEDPVGPAVRALRAQSASLKEFLQRISVMTTFAELQKAVGQ